MRASRKQAEENRKRVIAASSALFRERGFDGIGIVDLMKSAGLTQGGFYKQFASKEDLSRVACEQAHDENLVFWRDYLDGATDDQKALAAFVRAYLSPTHRMQPDKGCMLAALAPEARRREQPVRAVFAKAIDDYAEMLCPLMPAANGAEQRKAALALLAQMVGALSLARAVPDPAVSDEILDAAVQAITTGIAAQAPANS
ncbi:TetR/AcrR family transcriptional regulator [Mesorhizobium sp. ANAO-SY3R2]|uniref:TetR/AcrR family transcriptional regulator n=1 Tax=Mesorhizobium sp. ANAO-SY3R2 TaxID=3166644 RepID=UPI00366DA1C5